MNALSLGFFLQNVHFGFFLILLEQLLLKNKHDFSLGPVISDADRMNVKTNLKQ